MVTLPSFDQLKQMAESDPQALEQLRQQLIDQTISSAKPQRQQQLRAIQHNLDTRLDRCSNPTQRMLLASRLMHDKLHHLKQHLNGEQQQQKPAVVALR